MMTNVVGCCFPQVFRGILIDFLNEVHLVEQSAWLLFEYRHDLRLPLIAVTNVLGDSFHRILKGDICELPKVEIRVFIGFVWNMNTHQNNVTVTGIDNRWFRILNGLQALRVLVQVFEDRASLAQDTVCTEKRVVFVQHQYDMVCGVTRGVQHF